MRRRCVVAVVLLAGTTLAAAVGARENLPVPPPPPDPPESQQFPLVPKFHVESEVELGDCEPFTQDEAIVVEPLDGGGLKVSQCLVGYGEWIPRDEVTVLQQGDRLRISFLDHSRPFERDEPVPACSSTRRLVVTIARPVAPVASVSIEGWRVQAAGTATTDVGGR